MSPITLTIESPASPSAAVASRYLWMTHGVFSSISHNDSMSVPNQNRMATANAVGTT